MLKLMKAMRVCNITYQIEFNQLLLFCIYYMTLVPLYKQWVKSPVFVITFWGVNYFLASGYLPISHINFSILLIVLQIKISCKLVSSLLCKIWSQKWSLTILVNSLTKNRSLLHVEMPSHHSQLSLDLSAQYCK